MTLTFFDLGKSSSYIATSTTAKHVFIKRTGRTYLQTSSNYGFSWTTIPGSSMPVLSTGYVTVSISDNGQHLVVYISGTPTVYCSLDGGATWPYSKNIGASINYVAVNNTGQYIAILDQTKVYVSDDYGATFSDKTPVLSGTSDYRHASISDSGDIIVTCDLTGTADYACFTSTNAGDTWTRRDPFPEPHPVQCQSKEVMMDSTGDKVGITFAVTGPPYPIQQGLILLSDNGGIDWYEVGSSWTSLSSQIDVINCDSTGDVITVNYANQYPNQYSHVSFDRGISWDTVHYDITGYHAIIGFYRSGIATGGTKIYIVGKFGIERPFIYPAFPTGSAGKRAQFISWWN